MFKIAETVDRGPGYIHLVTRTYTFFGFVLRTSRHLEGT